MQLLQNAASVCIFDPFFMQVTDLQLVFFLFNVIYLYFIHPPQVDVYMRCR